jgi:N-carbamoylputrescine amidase
MNAWKTVQKSHAIANGCYVAGINRVGGEGGITVLGTFISSAALLVKCWPKAVK